MSDCNETLRELERFLDHELPARAKQAIDQHLDGCLTCLHAFDFHAELKSVIAAKARQVAVPEGLLARIEACFGLDADEILDS
jgi:anti-sigma factor (TIGR02949 family)